MILLTVGTQLPFDRLVRELDTIAPSLDEPIVGQVGVSTYTPVHFTGLVSIAPQDFEHTFRSARVIVGHAGIGTVLTAQKFHKPIILMARRVQFGEHRNDHQLATCAQLRSKQGIYIAEDGEELKQFLLRTDLLPTDPDAEDDGRAVFIGNLQEYFATN